MSGIVINHLFPRASCPTGRNSYWLVCTQVQATFPNCGDILPPRKASSTTSCWKHLRGTRGNDLGSKNGDVWDNPQPRHLNLLQDKEQGSETRWKWAGSKWTGLRYSPASWRQDREHWLSQDNATPLLGWFGLFELSLIHLNFTTKNDGHCLKPQPKQFIDNLVKSSTISLLSLKLVSAEFIGLQ